MIFITTGSRNFQFNRLLKAVDLAIEMGLIDDNVYAQIGSSDYKIRNYEYTDYLDHDSFNDYINKCDIVLTHGGTGVVVNSAKMGKRIVAVPRLQRYKEAVDDHQIQLIKAFAKLGLVAPCYKCKPEEIAKAIKESKAKEAPVYKSNTDIIIDSIDDYLKNEVIK